MYTSSYKYFDYDVDVNRKWLIFTGSLLTFIAVLSIFSLKINNVSTAVGFVLTAGIIYILHGYKFWQSRKIGCYLHVASGLLYVTIALMYINHNITVSIVNITAVSFIIAAIFRISVALANIRISLAWLPTAITSIYNLIAAGYMLYWGASYNTLLLIISGDILLTGISIFFLAYAKHHAVVSPKLYDINSINFHLQDVVQLLYDGQRCYEAHIKNVTDEHLKALFIRLADSRANLIDDIQRILGQDAVEVKGTWLGSFHKVYENLKSAITNDDPLVISKEIKRGENILIEAYKDALAVGVNEQLKIKLINHINQIENEIKQVDLLTIKVAT